MTKQGLLDFWEKSGTITDKKVLDAFIKVRREDFVLESDKKMAYADHPLHIGSGQTISQPTTVVIMTQALELKKGLKVLEVGTGSGYQAAIISEVVGGTGRVVSVEFSKPLFVFARENLKKYKNVRVVFGDGSKGYPRSAPYDRIIVTCAAPSVPETLIKQLKINGVLVVPVGSLYSQRMIKIRKTSKGLVKQDLGLFAFVPLRGEHGFSV